jgi:predicted DNA-binding transcriptional regulator AlpA
MSTERKLTVLRIPVVQKKLGDVSRATVYARCKPGSKQYREDFPKLVKDGGVSGFFEHEIDEYLMRLASRR